ncbi:hypothetical protein B0H14DRAFT_2760858 [Mycena olivaceomarginata]|nr:hypothetical protein B0H14DRAFT_2760858 [Mycena olivaceomarginata]
MEFTQQYYNARERNVHVWASNLGPTNRRCLVAGCWTDTGHQQISTQMFFLWLNAILEPNPTGLTYVLVWTGPNGPPQMQDTLPVRDFLQSVNTAIFQGAYQHRNSPGFLQEGNYLLFGVAPQTGLRVVLPELKSTPITSRTVTRPANTGTGTGTPRSRRSEAVRMHVRARDRRCRVTGATAPSRPRGTNYKGMQVAHIYPLGYWQNAQRLLSHGTMQILDFSNAKGDVDQNAVLMRSDVHDQFDDYQFGFWPMPNGVALFFRFEMSGAPSILTAAAANLNGPMALLPPGPLGNNAIAAPLPELFQQHFTTGLLWHVRGFGRERGK